MKKFFMAFVKKITRSETRFQKCIAISYAKYYLANIIYQILFQKCNALSYAKDKIFLEERGELCMILNCF